MHVRMLAIVSVLTALSSAAATTNSDASGIGRLRSNYKPGEVITAYSRYGNGSIQSTVRPAKWGWQVKLPGGAWTYCRRSCEETLRVQTVDFFGGDENSISDGGYGSLSRECGIFGCLGGSYEFSF